MAAAAGRGGLGHVAAWKVVARAGVWFGSDAALVLGKRTERMASAVWVRCLFTRSRIPDSVFQPRPGDHEKYGGDPEQPHKIHIITRIKCVVGRPYWEKKIIHDLGLDKNTATETTLWVANRRGNVRHLSYEQGRACH
ncbi:39S ribosomal protein L30, mitochondrial isoform X4 [Tyto alba]|uniref:39S ribosomal protein L30, mitochondrial isoform X4 n=1 Tax=Tyto alba TaxID=56313 RepID=UPI001401F5A7|nr:39S ribosomal protein L30, mitochondrial isoform X4 [Tyto alba]